MNVHPHLPTPSSETQCRKQRKNLVASGKHPPIIDYSPMRWIDQWSGFLWPRQWIKSLAVVCKYFHLEKNWNFQSFLFDFPFDFVRNQILAIFDQIPDSFWALTTFKFTAVYPHILSWFWPVGLTKFRLLT